MSCEVFAMKNDPEFKSDSRSKKRGFWQIVKEDGLNNASFGWGFFAGFLVHNLLLGVGKPGLLWRLF